MSKSEDLLKLIEKKTIFREYKPPRRESLKDIAKMFIEQDLPFVRSRLEKWANRKFKYYNLSKNEFDKIWATCQKLRGKE